MKKLHLIAAAITIILMGSFTNIFAAEIVSLSEIPNELIVRNPKRHDASLAISAEAVLYKLKQNQ